MSLNRRAYALLAAILVCGLIVVAGLHSFAETGQWAPASWTGGATKSDQHDSAVGSDIAKPKP